MGNTLFTAAGWPRRWVRWVVLGLVLGCGLFVELGVPEIGLMEARNFVAAREIHAGGSWLLPTLNGELRLAKPPLPTWLVAGVMHLTGNTTDLGLLRLPSAVGACLLVLFFWKLARQLTPPTDEGRTAWLAALVLASSLLLLTVGRDGNGWDVYCYCFATGALAALMRALQFPGQGWGWFSLAGILLGLSTLSKGPVALYGMVLPFGLAYVWKFDCASVRGHRWPLLFMVGLALGVAAAWPLYVYLNHTSEATQVAQAESASWANRHVQPLWYYLNFPVFMGVWALAALGALVWPYARKRCQAYVPYGFALAWASLTILLLSLVPEKKERYLLPVLPPLALLVAGLLRYWLATAPQQLQRTDRWLLRFWLIVLGLAALATPVALGWARLPSFSLMSLRFWLMVGVCLLLIVGLLAFFTQRGAAAAVVGSSLVVVTTTALLMPAYSEWRRRRDDAGLRSQAQVVAAHRELRELPVYSLSPMQVKWVWAAGRGVPLIPAADGPAPFRHLPVVVYAAQRGEAAIPKTWRNQLQVVSLDSFNLGHHHADGKWYVALLKKR
ncbi:ArnT family glycosyltransferase [Hymenobacter latericus]|uniref:ArnT family glycosyltransferase n=1 Tax=Hymenobacter sp. YIM 151858-1 TaxID=2987688 RepID=UPI0022267F7E|nr:glycosyltransferase family 39 protein [Hymenobacter sp. YIM 151858-1]UYZ60228.1 glycosyltransferase family 39 protein [Hymenobacter sp. YIM 151858-1]